MKQTILFVAENVTLAQVVRLAVLAESLDRSRYDVHFASNGFDPLIFSDLNVTRHELHSIDKSRVEKALATGGRIYDQRTLFRYVRADLDLIERVAPSLIIGDFRLSLAISAPVSRVPHATLVNAYWSPYRAERTFPVPDHPIVNLLGEELTQQYFPKALPKVFEHFAAPVNTVRRRYGLPPVGSLQEVLTHGDYTLYPDVPSLVPLRHAPAEHLFLGPVHWSPRVDFDPARLGRPDGRPLVYVTLGSSGKVETLPSVLEALGHLPVRVILATAARARLGRLPANVEAYEFVPGERVASAAAVVVSNGGSTTGYQALGVGTPVVGIASNFDQYLAMQAIERAGAGVLLKARSVTANAVGDAVQRVLGEPSFVMAAQRVAADFAKFPAHRLFPEFVAAATRRFLGHEQEPSLVTASGNSR